MRRRPVLMIKMQLAKIVYNLNRKPKNSMLKDGLINNAKQLRSEISRLIAIQRLEEADRLTNTMALSKRKSILTD